MTQFFNAKKEYWRQHYADALPPGYRRVEYLESTGKQWIDTGVSGNKPLKLQIDVSFTQFVAGAAQVMGLGAQSGIACRCAVGQAYTSSTSSFFFYAGLGSLNLSKDSIVLSTGVRYTMFSNVVHSVAGIDNVEFYEPGMTFTPSNVHLSLFTRSCTISDCPCYCRLYNANISDSASNLRNYVPCVRVSDNKPGMYDLCGIISAKTGTSFYVNEGTGADFLWGELQ